MSPSPLTRGRHDMDGITKTIIAVGLFGLMAVAFAML